jgi:acetyl esterase/lipase
MASKIPSLDPTFTNQVYKEDTVATRGGISLEGQQSQNGPNFSDPRVAFAMTHIANGKVWDACFPSKNFKQIDPALNIRPDFPPLCIVHGDADMMVPMRLSKKMFEKLKHAGVDCEMIEVPGEEHTFAGKMVKESQTWERQRRGFDWVEKRIRSSA